MCPVYDERLGVPLRWWALATMFLASMLIAFLVATPAWVAVAGTAVLVALVLTLFLSSAQLKTLPLMLWGDINYRLNPVLAVVSTLEVLLVVGGLFLARPVLATSQKAT